MAEQLSEKMSGQYFNKAEALREKDAAGRLIYNKDYSGAREKLFKARQVFPTLANIDAMVAVCDILAASTFTIPGYETEYYWVLGIIPSSSFDDILNRHEKLLKLLMPIKNKFPGVDWALKLIEEAVSVLSDRDKRLSYDLRRKVSWDGYESSDLNLSICCNVTDKEKGITTQSSGTLEEKNEMNLVASENIDNQVAVNIEEIVASSSNVSSDENNLEKEIAPLFPKPLSLSRMDQDFYNFGDDRKPFHFEKGQIWAVHYRSRNSHNYQYAQINHYSVSSTEFTWLKPVPVTTSERRWCDIGLPVVCGTFFLDLENTETINSPDLFSHNCSWVSGITHDQFVIYPKKGEVWAVYENWDLEEWSYNPDILNGCKLRLVEFLSNYSKYLGAKCVYLEKVNGFRSIFARVREGDNSATLHISPIKLYMLSHKVPSYRFSGGEINVGVIAGMLELDLLALPKYLADDTDSDITSNGEYLEISRFSPSREELLPLPLVDPEPEVEILGTHLSNSNYIAGQIWAVSVEVDSMPRQYVRINKVEAGDQICVTFLEPQPILDYEKTWQKEKLTIACGTFAATGRNVNLKLSQLSHLVKCLMSTTNTVYRIYPMKGQVWALYKNWENKWKRFDYENSDFYIVEVLSDLSEGSGITIARLKEVEGCLTFFHKQKFEVFDLNGVVSKAEVISFSHQIPAFRVPGIGNHGIPESSWHLEPSALPCK